MWSEQHVQELVKTIKELREDLEEYDNLNKKIADLITNTANALHGKPLENGLHSWHDLPELVEKLRNERDEARRELCAARRELCRNEAIIRLQRNRVHRDSEDVVGLAKEIAVERGWDCFKENSNV